MTRPSSRPRAVPRLAATLLTCLTGALTASDAGRAQQPAVSPGSRVVEVRVPAPSLAGNLVGTEAEQGAAIYLPSGYALETARRYPVVYLLHGIFDSHSTWLDYHRLPSLLDDLISTGEIPELIVVMPDGGNRYGGGFYRNSPVTGNWADFVAGDLVAFVDAGYRTLARREGRAVAGHSMGGYGALHLGMTRPDVFSVLWAMSPCCLAAADDFGFGNDAWKRAARVQGPDELPALLERNDFYAVAALGVMAAFQPDPDNPPLHVDFPFDLVRGETVLDDTAYDRYLDRLPVRRVGASREALRSLRGLGLGVGLGDQFLHIPTGSLELAGRLGEERIPFLLDVYAGDHRQEVRRRLEEVVLPWIGERLAVE
ncbi:MAG: alpha/beta fold hydrolase [Thermoanaerobaculia bacterium]|nr:alpha/beta fold hydrolase [Thermoanaerobaculia bacterium]